jgi:signal peptidase I
VFTASYVKHSKLLLRHAQKFLRYKADVLEESTREEIAAAMRRLHAALRQRDRKQIEGRAEALDGQLHRLQPITWESHWRENCEVVLVAIVVAVAIRSYFLQPFKIPTGSMQPTLNGIIGHPGDSPAPNFLRRVVDFAVLGRNYIDVVSAMDDEVIQITPKKYLFFFTFSRLILQHQSFTVYAPPDTLRAPIGKGGFGVQVDHVYHRGEVIARGAVDTGDQVFVDKFSYNFIKPRRGDVFVFRTDNIPMIQGDLETGQPFYIKRLAGLPGDTLRIDPPRLFINEQPAEEFRYGFGRVIRAKFPYQGYYAGRENLSAPDRTFTVPAHAFFALGDNSYNSFDSRYWGPVPDENLVGRGLFVYWPFYPHCGIIR